MSFVKLLIAVKFTLILVGGALAHPASVHAASSANEGRPVVFTITLPKPVPEKMRYRYIFKTVGGTAIENKDYRPVNGKLFFRSGEQTKMVSVETLVDQDNEFDERFTLQLSNGKARAFGWRSRYLQFHWLNSLPKRRTLTGIIKNVKPPRYENQKYGAGFTGRRFGE